MKIYTTNLDLGQVKFFTDNNDIFGCDVNLQYIFMNPELLGNLKREIKRLSTNGLVDIAYTTDEYVQALPMVSFKTYIKDIDDAKMKDIMAHLFPYISATIG